MPKDKSRDKKKHNTEVRRSQIWRAFYRLLASNNFDEISVQNICDEAGVHRTTFYNYFYDVYDLLQYGMSILGKNLIPPRITSFDIVIMSNTVFEFINGNQSELRHMISSNNDINSGLIAAIEDVLERYLYQAIFADRDRYKLKLPIDVVAKFFCAGMTKILFEWLQGPFDQSKVATQISGLIELIKDSCLDSHNK
ncbi:hypothetical protein LFAB_08325 [Lactiplantibacillus fabifermentans T30PCM01]|uniref:HTH tetR-type domain-containing protein n=1 Tax=Lactiplantibacillus fabifermentans T30PCM01 TaxID=1400520 RepID=W6T7J4_9LACO|nr:TetR/AcrR family transcriptional regulator [Lactiplantibacillus fabifermentans]ETY74276.1 hypothetical protein LFAB_08325 [Lactiplantibacillus fabifermentans T30PCM01]